MWKPDRRSAALAAHRRVDGSHGRSNRRGRFFAKRYTQYLKQGASSREEGKTKTKAKLMKVKEWSRDQDAACHTRPKKKKYKNMQREKDARPLSPHIRISTTRSRQLVPLLEFKYVVLTACSVVSIIKGCFSAMSSSTRLNRRVLLTQSEVYARNLSTNVGD